MQTSSDRFECLDRGHELAIVRVDGGVQYECDTCGLREQVKVGMPQT